MKNKKIPIGYSVGSGGMIGPRRTPAIAAATVVATISGQPIRVMQLVKLSWRRRAATAIGAARPGRRALALAPEAPA